MNKKKVAIMGYSGHSYVCIDIARLSNMEVVGYHESIEKDYNPFKLKYLGTDYECDPCIPLFVGIGENKIRQMVYEKMKIQKKFLFEIIIHPKSLISEHSKFGENTMVSGGSIINSFAKIGIGCIINTGAIVEHECEIGNFAHIAPSATLAGNVKIGERTFIGANASVKQGVSICNDVIIGTGSVVLNDIVNPGVYVGNPIRRIK